MDKSHIKSALLRGFRMLAISFVAAGTTGVTVLQQRLQASDGEPNWQVVSASASTAFLVAFATSLLRMMDLSAGTTTTSTNSTTTTSSTTKGTT